MIGVDTDSAMTGLVIDVIAGARPNFMKVAALFARAAQFPTLNLRLVHTGQHYDLNMSDVFMQDLNLPEPAFHLGVGSGSHAAQTAEIMKRYESWIVEQRPDLCVVVGDVNSTIACALVAVKESIRVAHVESGLRSFDRTMPEEINRVLTDSISDLMFVTEPSAIANLTREGRPASGIHHVGNTMIDTLLRMLPKARELDPRQICGVQPGEFAYLTLHRPANVDDGEVLGEICDQLCWLAEQITVAFPIHPRTRKRLQETGLERRLTGVKNLRLIEPLGYLDSLSLVMNARMVITDSGGLQEETTVLRIPCLTLRENTERPITVELGTNTLIGHDWDLFRQCVRQILSRQYKPGADSIPTWDGQAGQRILTILSQQ